MKKSGVQIDYLEYNQMDYLAKPRWISLWHQIDEVISTRPNRVLEIGVGNGIVTKVLKGLKIKVTTVDIDQALKPDRIADVRNLPFKSNSFDTVLCAQVLEHIPYEDLPKALTELRRVTRKHVVLTLPHDFLTYFLLTIKLLPYVKPITFFKAISSRKKHIFNGQHYWELGKSGYSIKKFTSLLKSTDMKILKSYQLSENPYHRFFILSKIK